MSEQLILGWSCILLAIIIGVISCIILNQKNQKIDELKITCSSNAYAVGSELKFCYRINNVEVWERISLENNK